MARQFSHDIPAGDQTEHDGAKLLWRAVATLHEIGDEGFVAFISHLALGAPAVAPGGFDLLQLLYAFV